MAAPARSRRDPETAGRPGEVVRRQGVAALIASGERKAFGLKHLYDLLRPDIRGVDRRLNRALARLLRNHKLRHLTNSSSVRVSWTLIHETG